MLSYLTVLSSFSDFFPSQFYFSSKSTCERVSFEDYHIHGSVFQNLYHNGAGGACSFEMLTARVAIESSLFNNCSAAFKGGAIDFRTTNGGLFLFKVCGFKCFSHTSGSDGAGQFGYHTITAINPIYYSLVTISQCSPLTMEGRHDSIHVQYGQNNFSEFNSSYNRGNRHVCQGCWWSDLSLKFSSFGHNIADSYACIGVSFGPFLAQYININNCFTKEYGLIHHNGDYSHEGYSGNTIYSVFMDNNGIVFDICCGGSMMVKNSVFSAYSYGRDAPVTQNVSIGHFSLYKHRHYSTNNCDAEFPVDQEITFAFFGLTDKLPKIHYFALGLFFAIT